MELRDIVHESSQQYSTLSKQLCELERERSERLRWDIVPFIIDKDLKAFYYRGLSEWDRERGYLRDTCLSAQDSFKARLDYFRIPHENEQDVRVQSFGGK